jgi:hypothetical protein
MENRVRTRRFLDTPRHSEEAEDARDGANAHTGHSKQLTGSEDQGHRVLHGQPLALGLTVALASLGLFQGGGGTVSLGFDPRQLLAPVAILIGSLRGFVLPLLSAVSDCGPLAHHALSGQERPPQGTGDPSVR